MNAARRQHRRISPAILSTIVIAASLWPQVLPAAEDIIFELRPHCAKTSEQGSPFGPTPDADFLTRPKTPGTTCYNYPVRDPLTRETPVLQNGETLDMDLIIKNPDRRSIGRVRAWINYDPNVLMGTTVDLDSAFTIPTPGESGFSQEQGYVKIGATAPNSVSDATIVVARIRLNVKKAGNNTILSFYDAAGTAESHTAIFEKQGAQESNIVASYALGSLLVRLQGIDDTVQGGASSVAQGQNTSGLHQAAVPSSSATNTISIASSSRPAQASSVAPQSASKTSTAPQTGGVFHLLQVQNLRVTTEGSSVFLAWDPLLSSQLKGYNLYYGTVSGQYIQRRSVDQHSTTLTIRALPEGTTYYFAVRAFDTQNRESEFSQEVAVTVGNPNTSTSPLAASSSKDGGPQGRSPKTGGTVAGESGSATTLLLLVGVCAVAGMAIALRRQFSATTRIHS